MRLEEAIKFLREGKEVEVCIYDYDILTEPPKEGWIRLNLEYKGWSLWVLMSSTFRVVLK
jgi:hypothetical protein